MFKEIISAQNDKVKHWVSLLSDNRYRNTHRTFIMEGLKPLLELPKGAIKSLIFSDSQLAIGLFADEKFLVSESILKKISGTESPEGIIAEVKMPSKQSLDGLSRILALDGISDPGNFGTLLRTALGFGWDGICLLPSCCDMYNDKVVRAARGAHFRIPIVQMSVAELEKTTLKNRWYALVADLEGEAPEKSKSRNSILLVLGNEAKGPSEEIKKFCRKVTLSMPGEMESLNVAIAGGILMYILRPL